MILLLDEPGLSLHALAQADFLSYIDELAKSYQIIYSTHSPFMVSTGKLDKVRVVEDKVKEGTRVSGRLESSSDESVFPLQAALGYSIAQNLFVSKKNILVEGPADLILLLHISSIFEKGGKTHLNEGTFVPVGGLDKLITFVALLGASKLKLAVLSDKSASPNQQMEDLIKQKLIERRRVLDYSMFRVPASQEADIEDLLPIGEYLSAFEMVYKKDLSGKKPIEKNLPIHPRLVERLNKWLHVEGIVLKKDGGYNHYLVAQAILTPLTIASFSAEQLAAFEALFARLNNILL